MPPIATFNLILSIGVLAILTITILSMIGFLFSRLIRERLRNINYFHYIRLIGLIAISSSALALTYQIHYELAVCVLCWWQRIFIFPIDFIVVVTLWRRIRDNHIIIGLLALVGLFFAGYHYYYHFLGWVLGRAVFLPCSEGGLLPACVDHEGVLTFGFITIPFMSVVVLIAMVWLSFLAHQSRK